MRVVFSIFKLAERRKEQFQNTVVFTPSGTATFQSRDCHLFFSSTPPSRLFFSNATPPQISAYRSISLLRTGVFTRGKPIYRFARMLSSLLAGASATNLNASRSWYPGVVMPQLLHYWERAFLGLRRGNVRGL